MATVLLHPGDVYAQNPAAGQDWRGALSGSGLWSDNSDATYEVFDTHIISGYGVMEPLTTSGTVTAINLHVRAQATGGGGSTTMDPKLVHDDGVPANGPVYDLGFVGGSVPADSTTYDLMFASVGDLGAAVAQLTAGTSLLRFAADFAPFFVFEAWLELTLGGEAPPCHLYPRDDNQGVGTAAIWPPPSSGGPASYY